MSNKVLVIGKSGTGKSRSVLNLNPKETFIINVIGKPLPFRGWKSKYTPLSKTDSSGNMISTDRHDNILKTINYVDTERKDIKVGIIDDFQYVMSNDFMRRRKEKGFEKFTEIGGNAWDIIYKCGGGRDDLTWIFLSHSEENELGETKCKTIGKLLDDKICVEGMFSIVLNTLVEKSGEGQAKYWFETQNNGRSTSKSPEGMFESVKIPNDLSLVVNSIIDYDKGE